MENAHKVTTVVFDKTGTITAGVPSVARLVVVEEGEEGAVSSLALALAVLGDAESSSEHPLAAAILRFTRAALGCGQAVGRVEDFQAVPGCGLGARVSSVGRIVEQGAASPALAQYGQWRAQGSEGEFQLAGASVDCSVVRRSGSSLRVAGLESLINLQEEGGRGEGGIAVVGAQDRSYQVLVGNREWMQRNGVGVREEVERQLCREEELGRTAVVLAVEGRVLAILGIADTVKPEANLTVFTLKKAGLDVILLTGDNRKTAAAIARQAGISRLSETSLFNI